MLKHNSYFDGNVQSIGFSLEGNGQTVGVIAAGRYHFATGAPERMTIVSGRAEVELDGHNDTLTVAAGSAFEVPGNSGFTITVASDAAAYLCEFLPG
ncbi:pyrimidine/purine nucleoside phosphorylase [Immundisolibacter sp.]|uniref:pyrimidine/purine nucleoside phosphorylase n=1 Tax=Immundisolibacter sp. TaxID=1934948 RepID=UPI00356B3753